MRRGLRRDVPKSARALAGARGDRARAHSCSSPAMFAFSASVDPLIPILLIVGSGLVLFIVIAPDLAQAAHGGRRRGARPSEGTQGVHRVGRGRPHPHAAVADGRRARADQPERPRADAQALRGAAARTRSCSGRRSSGPSTSPCSTDRRTHPAGTRARTASAPARSRRASARCRRVRRRRPRRRAARAAVARRAAAAEAAGAAESEVPRLVAGARGHKSGPVGEAPDRPLSLAPRVSCNHMRSLPQQNNFRA